METLLALEAMDGATDIDFSSDEDDEDDVEEYLTSLASFSGSIAASLTSFSLSLLDRCLGLWVGGLGGEAGFSRGGSSAFSSLSLLGLELLLLDDFNFSLTFPTRPVGKVPFDFMSISILHVRCMFDAGMYVVHLKVQSNDFDHNIPGFHPPPPAAPSRSLSLLLWL